MQLTITTTVFLDVTRADSQVTQAEQAVHAAIVLANRSMDLLEAVQNSLGILRQAAVPSDQSGDLLDAQITLSQAEAALPHLATARDALMAARDGLGG